ncbi:hypothetical protein FCW05_12640 [Vibrio lentus]|nr:hypothetical protein FCW05_12640 [Vibrio lentus]
MKSVRGAGKAGNPLKNFIDEKGYPYLNLQLSRGRGCKHTKSRIHRLLAETFIPNPNNLPVVMHLDDDTSNYDLSNLKWGTQKQNMEQSSATGFYDTVKREAILCSPEGEHIHIRGFRTFSSAMGLDWGNFSKMMKGVHQTTKGWSLVEILK